MERLSIFALNKLWTVPRRFGRFGIQPISFHDATELRGRVCTGRQLRARCSCTSNCHRDISQDRCEGKSHSSHSQDRCEGQSHSSHALATPSPGAGMTGLASNAGTSLKPPQTFQSHGRCDAETSQGHPSQCVSQKVLVENACSRFLSMSLPW